MGKRTHQSACVEDVRMTTNLKDTMRKLISIALVLVMLFVQTDFSTFTGLRGLAEEVSGQSEPVEKAEASASPSETQTPKPTQAPTTVPTAAPVAAPTEAPVKAPPEAPAEEPADVPAEAPAEEPADVPAEAPADEPTDAPTEAPAEEPTEAPADEPTDAPTEAPAEEPTEAPADEPTDAPMEAPAEEPTEAPIEDFEDGEMLMAPAMLFSERSASEFAPRSKPPSGPRKTASYTSLSLKFSANSLSRRAHPSRTKSFTRCPPRRCTIPVPAFLSPLIPHMKTRPFEWLRRTTSSCWTITET